MRGRGDYFWLAGAGVLLSAALPPLHWWWLAWLAPALFFWRLLKIGAERGTDRKPATERELLWKAAWSGFVFGFFFFAFDLFWVTSLSRFAGIWAFGGWFLLVVLQAAYLALFAVLCRLTSRKFFVITFPLFWVLVEWLRTLGPFGVANGYLSAAQLSFLPAAQLAGLLTSYGLSFIIALAGVALAEFFFDRRLWRWWLLFLSVFFLNLGYGWLVMQSPVAPLNLRVALIQPNIDQLDKLNPRLVEETYQRHEALTRQAAKERPEIIIWPETAIFTYLLQDRRYQERFRALAKESGCWLVVGTPYLNKGAAYNSIVVVSPAGELTSRYDKVRLIPFGEYLPLRKVLYPLLRPLGFYDQDFSFGSGQVDFQIGPWRVVPGVCYESVFPLLIKRRAGGADFILNLTNDAWFGESAAAEYHFALGKMRAIENRLPFIQAANSGISGVVDPYGRVIRQTRLNSREVLLLDL